MGTRDSTLPPPLSRCTCKGSLRNLYIIILSVHAVGRGLSGAFATMRPRYALRWREAQLGKALQAAEPRLLQAQLNLHFLFHARTDCVH